MADGKKLHSTKMASFSELITRKLKQTNTFWFTVLTSLFAFCLYTSIYAFRKTFSVATFEHLEYAGISYKVWLVTFQVLGYATAKFIGIKIISELVRKQRAKGILIMAGIASLSWLFFALVPPPYNIIFLFTNGLPLGMVWGMVFGYLEGRRVTEVLGASLSVSFIFSAGLCRTVGSFIMIHWHVSEFWMPFVTCCLFTAPLLLFLFLLDKIPEPGIVDRNLRTERRPMNALDRKSFLKEFLPGIILFVLAYALLTTFREFRENFAADLWKSLGYAGSSSIYTQTETPITIFVLIIIGSLMMIKNNKTALMINHVIVLIGMVTIGISTFLYQQQMINAPVWMVAIGTGLYLGYVPFNSVFFDRLIATFKYAGTVGFIMYVADSFGYLGSVGVLFFKEFAFTQISWVTFFTSAGYAVSFIGTILISGSLFYFHWKSRQKSFG
jgi:MFS family permease